MEYMNIVENNLDVEEKEVWEIKDDLSADWTLDMIREKKAEFNRFKIIIDTKIDQLMQAMEVEEKKMKQDVSFFEAKLHEYFNSIDSKSVKVTKTQAKYKLPSGSLILKSKGPEYKRDDNKLVEYLEEYKKDLVKVKKSPDWAKFKKMIMNIEGTAVNKETGEHLDFIEIKERDPEFKVEV